MAQGAINYVDARSIKVKLTGDLMLDFDCVHAIREARPGVWLEVDSNQGCTADMLPSLMCVRLTEGVLMAAEARRLGLGVMVGNMIGSSLAMAPAFVLGQGCDIVDLDSPTFLAADRTPSVLYRYGSINSGPDVWGSGRETARCPRPTCCSLVAPSIPVTPKTRWACAIGRATAASQSIRSLARRSRPACPA